LGAVDAEEFCKKLDIEPAERVMVAWLVRYHLLMSQTAQRKDLSDPANIQDFAETVGNTRYLDHLYLLTVADIAGTDPKLWNNWKNKLLWDLYLAAGQALRRGLENPIKRATRIRETRSAQGRCPGGHQSSLGQPARDRILAPEPGSARVDDRGRRRLWRAADHRNAPGPTARGLRVAGQRAGPGRPVRHHHFGAGRDGNGRDVRAGPDHRGRLEL
jgi:[protein-PII] uridylyltransferase